MLVDGQGVLNVASVMAFYFHDVLANNWIIFAVNLELEVQCSRKSVNNISVEDACAT